MIKYLNYITLTLLLLTETFNLSSQSGLTLQATLQLAKNNNPTLNQERLNVNLVAADTITAAIISNPKLNNQSLQLFGTQNYHLNPNWYTPYNRQVWWQLTKTFQLAGQRENKILLAGKNVTVAEKNYLETERLILVDVASKWLEIWISQKQLITLQKAKITIDSLVSINKLRVKNQAMTTTDFSRTEIISRQYAIQLTTAQQQVTNLQKELAFMLGSNNPVFADTSSVFIGYEFSSLDSLLKNSLQNRSDVQTAQSLIDAANANIRLQRSLAIPQPELGFIFNPQNSIPYAGIYATIELPFFDRNQGEIKKSHIQQKYAEEVYLNTKNRIYNEINTAYATYKQQETAVDEFKTLLTESESILKNVQYTYVKGGTTIIDFLEAQRSWLETQELYFETLRQFRQSYIQLLYVTGLINQL